MKRIGLILVVGFLFLAGNGFACKSGKCSSGGDCKSYCLSHATCQPSQTIDVSCHGPSGFPAAGCDGNCKCSCSN